MLNEQLARKEYFWFAPALERFEAEDKALIRRVKVQFRCSFSSSFIFATKDVRYTLIYYPMSCKTLITRPPKLPPIPKLSVCGWVGQAQDP